MAKPKHEEFYRLVRDTNLNEQGDIVPHLAIRLKGLGLGEASQFYLNLGDLILTYAAQRFFPTSAIVNRHFNTVYAKSLDMDFQISRKLVPLKFLAEQLSPGLIKQEFANEARTLSYRNIAEAIDVRLNPPEPGGSGAAGAVPQL